MADDMNGSHIAAPGQGCGNLLNAIAARVQNNDLARAAVQVGLHILNSGIYKNNLAAHRGDVSDGRGLHCSQTGFLRAIPGLDRAFVSVRRHLGHNGFRYCFRGLGGRFVSREQRELLRCVGSFSRRRSITNRWWYKHRTVKLAFKCVRGARADSGIKDNPRLQRQPGVGCA